MSLKITKPIVSVDWLQSNLGNEKLIILDCTMPKVTVKSNTVIFEDKKQIKGAIFFDIKKTFSDANALYPNTILSPQEFEKRCQNLGINIDSTIVCYDDLGIYSSPRVWWMFKLMGFKNIVVLDGGFPKWEENKYPVEKHQKKIFVKGNFRVNYQLQKIKYTKDVFSAIENDGVFIVDARSKGRFNSTEPEPRNGLKRGHIPNSISLPFSEILDKGMLKTEDDLKVIFSEINPENKELIFTCGTGITASVLALGAEILGIKKYSVYDGSWTEWASTESLPIEK
ncbi:MAG: sulfurtransferase [Polaribacter sp.]|nr:sulfurtransferase [Polaribacter sp.]